jgi:pyruvate dehydrogenase E2 component (dihydrolipoamide acetyltransferase)
MATEVILPKVDMVMETGTFVEWLKQEGDLVQKGEPLFVILTDKAAIEIEAPASGVLSRLKAKPDEVIPVSQTIAYILEPGEQLQQVDGIQPAVQEALVGDVTTSVALPSVGLQPGEATPGARNGFQGKIRATPVARRLAAELGLDLAAIAGRGPKGRVQRADVLDAADRQTVAGIPSIQQGVASYEVIRELQMPLPDARRKAVMRLAGPRKIIAERMAYSASVAPHITLSLNVDMSEATRLRERVLDQIEQKTGQRLSFTAILARAVAATLPRHPYLNASLAGEEVIFWEDVHLGIATSLEDYLIVPVIREAQSKNLEQIVTTLADLVGRARLKHLTPAEMSGSTFTISNLGMFGIESFTAIINPPESAILAVGKIEERQVVTRDGLVVRPMMNLTLSADHRVVDGAAAALFLADLKTHIF